MNIVKFKPVGRPSARETRVKVTQSKAAMYGQKPGTKRRPTVAEATRMMDRKGFVRSGVRK
jgi:hypothetical protein